MTAFSVSVGAATSPSGLAGNDDSVEAPLATSAAPQSPQNRLPAGLSTPHRAQRFASAAPQSPQNLLPGFSAPHLEQRIGTPGPLDPTRSMSEFARRVAVRPNLTMPRFNETSKIALSSRAGGLDLSGPRPSARSKSPSQPKASPGKELNWGATIKTPRPIGRSSGSLDDPRGYYPFGEWRSTDLPRRGGSVCLILGGSSV